MRMIGFSTGALALGDYRHALEMLVDKDVNALELSALRQDELQPLVEDLDNRSAEIPTRTDRGPRLADQSTGAV